MAAEGVATSPSQGARWADAEGQDGEKGLIGKSGMDLKMAAAILLSLLGTPAAIASPPPPWGRTPFFGGATAYEASDSVLQHQLEQYGSDLSDAVNKLRDMANVARSPTLHGVLLGKVDRVVACWQENLQVLESVLLRTFPRAPAVADCDCSQQQHGPNTENSSAARDAANGTDNFELYTKTSYDDVYQVFHHITRDWSQAGAPIRREIYQPVVRLLAHEQALQVGEGTQQLLRVLVPGSGLGRLAYDLAHAGLSVTGMEVSTLMLSAAFALFNSRKPNVPAGSSLSQQMRLYPYIHDEYTNEMSGQARFEAVFVPDVEIVQTTTVRRDTQNTTEKLTASRHSQLHLSFVQADFVESFLRFSSRSAEYDRKNGTASRCVDEGVGDKLTCNDTSVTCPQLYDVVVTCFLIDAVSHVEDAIAAVHAALRPGGLWVNVGPLQWHEHSVMHLALDELLQVVQGAGFDLKDVKELKDVAYRSASDDAGTRPMLYRPVLWAARRL